MKPVTQLHDFGCGAACVAFILKIDYEEVSVQLGEEQCKKAGFGCQKLCSFLTKYGLHYRFKKYNPNLDHLLRENFTIVFVKRSKKYPFGHYLVLFNGLWMDPWINLQDSQDIRFTVSGFRTRLPGQPEFILYPV